MTIVVYVKPNNQPSERLVEALNQHGVEHTAVDIFNDGGAMQAMKAFGSYLQAPVVVVNDILQWSGNIPHCVVELAARHTH